MIESRTVSYVDLGAQHAPLKGEILDAVSSLLDKGDFILGEAVKSFEEDIAAYCGTRYAIGVNSGTDALFLALKAWGVGPGDEVITAPNSFLASASVIVAVGAKPVFVDVADDMNIDPERIESAITSKTKAIIPVHLSGRPAKMDPINDIARKHGLKVVEDAAQSIAATYKGQKTGALGDAGAFSLHPLKTLNACGDGGVLTTDDEDLYTMMLQLRNIGMKNRNEFDVWGYNSRLDSIQAAILRIKLKHLDEWTAVRRGHAKRYQEKLNQSIWIPKDGEGEQGAYHTFVIRIQKRDALMDYLKEHGVDSKIHYPIAIHLQSASKQFGYKRGDFPNTEKFVNEIISLPIHQDLTMDDIDYVSRIVNQFVERN